MPCYWFSLFSPWCCSYLWHSWDVGGIRRDPFDASWDIVRDIASHKSKTLEIRCTRARVTEVEIIFTLFFFSFFWLNMQYSALWVSNYSTQKRTPIKSNTENRRSNPTTWVEIQRPTFKYRRERLIYDYSFLWFAGNASIVRVGTLRVCRRKKKQLKKIQP